MTEAVQLLQRIDIDTYPKAQLAELWDSLASQPWQFDDLSKGNAQSFLANLLLPNSEHYVIGEMQGYVMVNNIQPRAGAVVHFAHWGAVSIRSIVTAARELFDRLFEEHQLSRITAFIPDGNDPARRLATHLGFKLEGTMKKAFLYEGKYRDLMLYGLTADDHVRLRRL